MTKQGARMAVVATAIGVMLLLVWGHSAAAQQASFPRIARGINTWMARAMDACTSNNVTVVSPGLPPGGCAQSNTVTDNTLGMNYVKLRVNRNGKIGLLGTGFTLGDSLRVRMTLRVTKADDPPSSNQRVTFADFTVDCPLAPDAFLVRPNGSVVGRTDFTTCLSPNTALGTGSNIEIMSASLVNAATGQVVASPGILK